ERDPSWTPFINTPMHPEYPCAHCIVSGAIGTVLEADIGSGGGAVLSTTSPTANGAKRTWAKLDDFMQEVANGRIYDGVHFRTSTEVGTDMGRKIGKVAAAKYLSK
ncbi:MAG TPA: vanadium-dependent haloperoxidase, partial [Pyrinomonadaceae bacterium]|nr:vanadium-dependent haloperoxidase [Pyrinomonadaceae bacterium]